MNRKNQIESVLGREILDSRGNPTIEVEIALESGIRERAAVPSGASTGQFEAVELRDGGERYGGKGVLKAVANVNEEFGRYLPGEEVFKQATLDMQLTKLDGTENKERLGANGMLGISMAMARCAARSAGLPLYRYLGGIGSRQLPVPMMNVLNGGAHASNNIDIQEFMIMPVGAGNFREGLEWCVNVYHTLKRLLKERGLATAVGDEGGFAPNLDSDEEALDLLVEAIKESGYEPGRDFQLAMDAAASEWKGEEVGQYHLPKRGKDYSGQELITYWRELCQKYPIRSLEDPLDEEDWDNWKDLTEELGDRVQLVGDDLFVTNTKRLKKGILMGVANAILIKVNQIGTLSETMEAIEMAHKAGYKAVISHRSGETADTFISDLAVAVNAGQIKTGAPCRSDRTEKYNQLLRIEEELGSLERYGI